MSIVNDIISPFICNIRRGGGGAGIPMNICMPKTNYPQGAPPTDTFYGTTFYYVGENKSGYCFTRILPQDYTTNRGKLGTLSGQT